MRYNTVPDIQSIPSKYQLLLLPQFSGWFFCSWFFFPCNFSSPQLLEESSDAGFCTISSCLKPQSGFCTISSCLKPQSGTVLLHLGVRPDCSSGRQKLSLSSHLTIQTSGSLPLSPSLESSGRWLPRAPYWTHSSSSFSHSW